MSSPVPPPSPRSRRPDHSFELSSDLKKSSKIQRTNKPTRGRGVPKSSSFSKQEPVSANASAAISGQSTLKRSYILDWLTGNLSKYPPGSSSEGSSSSQLNLNNTTNSGSNLPLGKSSLQCMDVSKSSQQRTSSTLPSGSAAKVQSSFHPWHATESGSSSQGTCSSPGLHVQQMESSSNDILPSKFASGYVDKGHVVDGQTDPSSEKMVESFKEKLSILEMHKENKEEKHNSEQARKGSKDEKPVITYVRRHKMTHYGVEKNRKEMQMVKEYKPVDVPDDGDFDNMNENIPVDVPDERDIDDMNEKMSNFRSTKFHKNPQILNLEKNVAPSFKDQEESVQENEDKKGKTPQESNQGSGDKKGKGKEHEKEKKKKKKKEKKKNKEKEPNQEPQIEINLPKFSRQLTPQEIADDIFAMTGSMPSTKAKRRTKIVQRHVDQLTPGLWLGSIDADRYKVHEKSKKGK